MHRIDRTIDDRGASAVEYGLIVFAIAAVIALVVYAFGGVVVELFQDSCTAFTDQPSVAGSCP